MLRKLTSILALAALFAVAQTQPKLDFNVKDGDKIAGDKTVEVTVTSDDLVTSVEFYVNGELRDTDDSTPYEFKIDGIAEPEGKFTLKVSAHTTKGKSAAKTLNLEIDNGLSRGPEFFSKQGEDQLKDGKYDDAIVSGLLGLKAKTGFNPARMVLAKANLRKGIFDSAQKFAEDVVASDPTNTAALDIVSAVSLQRAFNIVSRTKDRNETLTILRTAFQSAAKARAKVYNMKMDKFGAVTPENLLDYSDTAIRSGRFKLAIDALNAAFLKDSTRSDVMDRLVYAYMRSGRFDQAAPILFQAQKKNMLDGVGQALLAILYARAGDDAKSTVAEREALLSDSTSIGVRTAQAYLARYRNRPAEFARITKALAKDAAENSEVSYYFSAFNYDAKEYEGSRVAFERGLLAEPMSYDLLLLRANQAIEFSTKVTEQKEIDYQRQTARVYYDSALAVKPESFEALSGLAILNFNENKGESALNLARAAVVANPQFGAGHYTLAMIAQAQSKRFRDIETAAKISMGKAQQNGLTDEAKKFADQMAAANSAARKLTGEAEQAMKDAAKVDPVHLGGRTIPDSATAWKFLSTFGQTPLITLTR
ncbi:MAG: hypothetical protein K8R88_08445 [Armatimonadetes bacterium]|nr:hypothetical protein [Armatimonadota bacterium]